jgi:hypothetical protein
MADDSQPEAHHTKPAIPGKGLRCPRCWCVLVPCYKTVRQPGKIRRYRKCSHCGKNMICVERIEAAA